MTFEEILPALKKGNKIRRKSWSNEDAYCYCSKGLRLLFNNRFYEFDNDDIFANDWELFKGTIKIKLKNLTEEEYQKWKNKNCKKYDCFDCPFRCIDCNKFFWMSCKDMYSDKFFWMSCKDMYSDKFLDQEIEVEV